MRAKRTRQKNNSPPISLFCCTFMEKSNTATMKLILIFSSLEDNLLEDLSTTKLQCMWSGEHYEVGVCSNSLKAGIVLDESFLRHSASPVPVFTETGPERQTSWQTQTDLNKGTYRLLWEGRSSLVTDNSIVTSLIHHCTPTAVLSDSLHRACKLALHSLENCCKGWRGVRLFQCESVLTSFLYLKLLLHIVVVVLQREAIELALVFSQLVPRECRHECCVMCASLPSSGIFNYNRSQGVKCKQWRK